MKLQRGLQLVLILTTAATGSAATSIWPAGATTARASLRIGARRAAGEGNLIDYNGNGQFLDSLDEVNDAGKIPDAVDLESAFLNAWGLRAASDPQPAVAGDLHLPLQSLVFDRLQELIFLLVGVRGADLDVQPLL